MCVLEPKQLILQMCGIGGARILGTKPADNLRYSSNWQVAPSEFPFSLNTHMLIQHSFSNNIARAIGKIFDSCWRADDTVLGADGCIGNPKLRVNMWGPVEDN
jgi:hypothetical protein